MGELFDGNVGLFLMGVSVLKYPCQYESYDGNTQTWSEVSTRGVTAMLVVLFLLCLMIVMLWFWWRDREDIFERKVDDRAAWERQQRQLETAKQREILRRKEAAVLKRKATRAQARALKEGSETKSPGRTVPETRTSASSTSRNKNSDQDRWSWDEYADYMGLRTDDEEHDRQMFLAEEETDRMFEEFSREVQEDNNDDNWYYDDNGNYHEG